MKDIVKLAAVIRTVGDVCAGASTYVDAPTALHSPSFRRDRPAACGRYMAMRLANMLSEGEEIELVMPMASVLWGEVKGWVRCQAKVVRIEQAAEGKLGAAVAVRSYEGIGRT